jgi:hypothetical protein
MVELRSTKTTQSKRLPISENSPKVVTLPLAAEELCVKVMLLKIIAPRIWL